MTEPTAEWHAAAVRWPTTRDAVVTPLHAYFSPSHLAYVVDEMRRLGQPRIKAFFDDVTGAWFALEGTHRLRAARLLEIVPVMVFAACGDVTFTVRLRISDLDIEQARAEGK